MNTGDICTCACVPQWSRQVACWSCPSASGSSSSWGCSLLCSVCSLDRRPCRRSRRRKGRRRSSRQSWRDPAENDELPMMMTTFSSFHPQSPLSLIQCPQKQVATERLIHRQGERKEARETASEKEEQRKGGRSTTPLLVKTKPPDSPDNPDNGMEQILNQDNDLNSVDATNGWPPPSSLSLCLSLSS